MMISTAKVLAYPDYEEEASAFDHMAWTEPKFSREEINSSAKIFLTAPVEDMGIWPEAQWDKYDHALEVINNWRASHAYPLNTIQVNLRNSARRFDDSPLIAQRIKRLASIAHKLHRFEDMKLSQMQDLGGCRAILDNVSTVRKLVNYYLKESRIKHPLASRDNYIDNPKDSGYRGVHLVYRYYSDKKPKQIYNGLKIEIQLRSRYQHAWATAVETVGTFSGQALKSSLGDADWNRFFALMGSLIASREKTSLVPNTPTKKAALISELKHYAHLLKVRDRLREYGNAVKAISNAPPEAYYFLLQLDPSAGQLNISGFDASQMEQASALYADAERSVQEKKGSDAVLVSVDTVNSLQRAYPNYFADTRVFLELMEQVLSGHSRGIDVPPRSIKTT